MFLSCQVTGGRNQLLALSYIFRLLIFAFNTGHPLPKLTWWRDGIQMTNLVDHEGLSAMVNHLKISSVKRDMYGARLECRAHGSDLVVPVKKEVIVQLHRKKKTQYLICLFKIHEKLKCHIVKPLKVKIVSPNDLLLAGKAMPIICETWGSFPPAKVMWLLDGEPITRNTEITMQSDNSEASIFIQCIQLKN